MRPIDQYDEMPNPELLDELRSVHGSLDILDRRQEVIDRRQLEIRADRLTALSHEQRLLELLGVEVGMPS